MNLDNVLDAWRSQDDESPYDVDYGRLREALQRERVNTRRSLRSEAWHTYNMSAALFAGLAFVFLLMAYDEDPRTVWDFVIVILGAAGALLWGAQLYVSRRMQAQRERRFGISLRDDIGCHLALLEYQISRLWRVSSVLLSTLPLFCCVFALWIALGLINNEPVQDWNWMVGGAVFAGMIMMMVYEFTNARRAAEQEILPLKRRLEALLERLQAQ